MKKSGLVKAFLLIILGVSAFFITSSILAQHEPKPSANKQGSAGVRIGGRPGTIAVTVEDDHSVRALAVVGTSSADLAEQLKSQNITSYHAVPSMNVNALDKHVSISASVSLFQSREHVKYHWSVRVYDRHFNEMYVNRNYDDQVFSIPVGSLESPTFDESIELLPGVYSVELVLHELPDDFDLNLLKDDAVEKSHRVLRCARRISLQYDRD